MRRARDKGRILVWWTVVVWLLVVAGGWGAVAVAGAIDTTVLEQPWPGQRSHEYEVDKYAVVWRQRIHAVDGLCAGAQFVAPSTLDATWRLANDYHGLGPMTPGVTAIRRVEHSATHQTLTIDMKVLWKTIQLVFEIEQQPPQATRFRLVNALVGEYQGVCLMRPVPLGTQVELATCLKPAVRVPAGLVLTVQRMLMLKGIRAFLQEAERRSS